MMKRRQRKPTPNAPGELLAIEDAERLLKKARSKGIDPRRDFKRVCIFQEREALEQAAAWTARAAAFREALEIMK